MTYSFFYCAFVNGCRFNNDPLMMKKAHNRSGDREEAYSIVSVEYG
tara:strand:+ start:149 stop:286 length:138 start_codon:yes stop_codon:yes gene_type:complete